ncbi:hypothetical protein [Rhodococcus sp. MTM3W5.2]|uniref:hypothetical protein n=1 Tax=Rhodococcus sp. MTM3W5.2 TaxID=1805827 RepID=UPI00097BD057|nr:hypothetical protein [Rhodococcus sp. MTM3W5.2]
MPVAVTPSPISRRSAFRIAGAASVGLTALALSAGCTSDSSDRDSAEPDPLISAAESARRDAATATAATALAPERAGALSVIASERGAHADALSAEVARAAGVDPTAMPSPSPTGSPTEPAPPPPTVDELRTQLATSQRDAAGLARRLSGYRAGLLGSISAAIAAEQAVLLL